MLVFYNFLYTVYSFFLEGEIISMKNHFSDLPEDVREDITPSEKDYAYPLADVILTRESLIL